MYLLKMDGRDGTALRAAELLFDCDYLTANL